jgi:hypothetical protein
LFGLALAGRFQSPESTVSGRGIQHVRPVRSALLARLAIACLIAGFLLLNIANAQWAHAAGLVFLLVFILVASRAITFTALGEQPTTD